MENLLCFRRCDTHASLVWSPRKEVSGTLGVNFGVKLESVGVILRSLVLSKQYQRVMDRRTDGHAQLTYHLTVVTLGEEWLKSS